VRLFGEVRIAEVKNEYMNCDNANKKNDKTLKSSISSHIPFTSNEEMRLKEEK